MKNKTTENPKDTDKGALPQEKKNRKPGELKDSDLENLAGGEGMNTGDILNP